MEVKVQSLLESISPYPPEPLFTWQLEIQISGGVSMWPQQSSSFGGETLTASPPAEDHLLKALLSSMNTASPHSSLFLPENKRRQEYYAGIHGK